MKQNQKKGNTQINRVETTPDTLTGRGGMVLFVKYMSNIMILQILEGFFGKIRKSAKGIAVEIIFKQIFCYLYDGTSRHLIYFDKLKKDEGYAGVTETAEEDMLSSHQVKRFFMKFKWLCGGPFRKVLKKMFIWRLQIQKPEVINLTLDTMVMDNDEALKRHGCQPTYKKVKGFQPLQLIWERKIVDAIFRGGKKHSNSGNTAVNMIRDIVTLIRQEYDPNVAIILRIDSGFFSETNFKAYDELNIGFICSGKMYAGVKDYVSGVQKDQWQSYDNGHQEWKYTEFGFRCNSWKRFYRAIYTKAVYEGKQMVFDFARPDNVILTNIGINSKLFSNLSTDQQEKMKETKTIISSHHQRGADELPHRGLKDFGFEELPFKRFSANTAFYYCMLIGFFLFETFKEDVLEEVIPIGSYATTVRRRALDFAAKIVKTGGQIILKITKSTMEDINFLKLWDRCQRPLPIAA